MIKVWARSFSYWKYQRWNSNRHGENSSGISGLAVFITRLTPGGHQLFSSLLTISCLCFPGDCCENISLFKVRQRYFYVAHLDRHLSAPLFKMILQAHKTTALVMSLLEMPKWTDVNQVATGCLRPSFLEVGQLMFIIHWLSKINLKCWPLKGQRINEF